MKKILPFLVLFLLLLTSSGIAGNDPNKPIKDRIKALRDSISKSKTDTASIRYYKSLCDQYTKLDNSLILLYRDTLDRHLNAIVNFTSKGPEDSAKHYKILFQQCDQRQARSTVAYKDSIDQCLDSIVVYKNKKKPAPRAITNSNMRIYTDLQGYGGNNPNGIMQTEFKWWWNMFNPVANIKNAEDTCLTKLYLFKNMTFPMVNISSLGEKFKGKPVNYFVDTVTQDTIHHIHTIDLVKYSMLSLSGQFNLLALNFESTKRKFNFYADLLGMVYRTQLKDSLLSNDNILVNSLGWGYNLCLEFYPKRSHWSLRACMKGFNLSLLNNNIHQNYGPVYEPESFEKNNQYFNKDKDSAYVWNYAFSAEIRYKQDISTTDSGESDLFLRIFYYNNVFNTGFRNKLNAGNNFLQLQVGVTKSIEDLVKFLGPKEKEKDKS
jgi:hypothetical protein